MSRKHKLAPPAPGPNASAPASAEPADRLSVAGMRRFVADLLKKPAVNVPIAIVVALAALGHKFTDLKASWEALFPPKAEVREIVKQLTDANPAVRLAALSQLAQAKPRQQEDLQLGVSSLQQMIVREGAGDRKPTDAQGGSPEELATAIGTLGRLLEAADKRKLALKRPELKGLDLSGLDLGGAYLRGITLRDVDLHDTRLTHADLHGATIENSQLSRVDATEADFGGTSLKRVCFEGARLTHANLSNAVVSASDFNTASLAQADMSATVLQETRMNGAVMTNVVASGADLAGASEWTPQQASQLGPHDGAKLPRGYQRAELKICG